MPNFKQILLPRVPRVSKTNYKKTDKMSSTFFPLLFLNSLFLAVGLRGNLLHRSNSFGINTKFTGVNSSPEICPKGIQQHRHIFTLSDNVSPEENVSSFEKKYVVAFVVFLFAALYDFFVTHGGKLYLQHPVS